MDELIQKKVDFAFLKKGGLALIVLLIVGFIWQSTSWSSIQTLKVEESDIAVAPVVSSQFSTNIRFRAQVDSQNTYYLDVINGGRVEEIYVESGQSVSAGNILVELSNPAVQLSVVRSDAEVTQQLNNINTLELQLQQNKLQHRRNLADIDYNIRLLTNKISRLSKLSDIQATSEAELEYMRIELDWYQKQKQIVLESQSNDTSMQEQQITQLRRSVKSLQSNLEVSQRSLESLKVKAPISGQLGNFELRIGQSISQGERVGQIDEPGKLKLSADLDEFYVNQVSVGQKVTITMNGKSYDLSISKVYPEIRQNRFRVDIDLNNVMPGEIIYGQTIQANLQLSDATESLIVANGNFYQSTGGNWAMVLAKDGKKAVKREVKLGRRNSESIEVERGLKEGEIIIVSSYERFINIDEIIIN